MSDSESTQNPNQGPNPKPDFDPKTVTVSYEQLEDAGAKSKSQIIRYLDALGYERAAIAKFLNVKYQHVRNVLTQPLKRQIKLQMEQAKLAGRHPSVLTERQKAMIASAGAPTTDVERHIFKVLSDAPDMPRPPGEVEEEGWVSPALKPDPVTAIGKVKSRRKRA